MRTYKMYALATDSDDLAHLTVLRSGRIKSVRWIFNDDGANTNGQKATIELSVKSVSSFLINDSQGDIDQFTMGVLVATSVGIEKKMYALQKFLDYPVAAGERLYIHGSVSITTSPWVVCFIDILEVRGN